ncbi:MAG: hypothetical protein LAP21_17495 [Acidobacteriia bacterium]|nr:hypothetical protein [Terriglobia bacterium]
MDERQHEAALAALRAAIDEGDASGIAEDNVFERVRETMNLSVEVDDETLAAIDRGLEAIKEGRVVSSEEARQRIQKWSTKSSPQKTR